MHNNNIPPNSTCSGHCKYKPEYATNLIEWADSIYDQVMATNTITPNSPLHRYVPTMQEYARKIKFHLDTLYEWRKHHPDLDKAIEHVANIREDLVIKLGLAGKFKVPMVALFLKNRHKDWKDVDEDKQNITIVIPKDDAGA